jgi:hypothetical protein
MWRIAALLLALSCANVLCAVGETIRVTTWNLEWFPAGSEKSLPPAVEQQRIAAAAEQLKILNPDVLLLQEIRDWDTCERLITALRPVQYHTLVCSAFRESFGGGSEDNRSPFWRNGRPKLLGVKVGSIKERSILRAVSLSPPYVMAVAMLASIHSI